MNGLELCSKKNNKSVGPVQKIHKNIHSKQYNRIKFHEYILKQIYNKKNSVLKIMLKSIKFRRNNKKNKFLRFITLLYRSLFLVDTNIIFFIIQGKLRFYHKTSPTSNYYIVKFLV